MGEGMIPVRAVPCFPHNFSPSKHQNQTAKKDKRGKKNETTMFLLIGLSRTNSFFFFFNNHANLILVLLSSLCFLVGSSLNFISDFNEVEENAQNLVGLTVH